MIQKKWACNLCIAQKRPAVIQGDPLKHLLTAHSPTEFFSEIKTFDWEDITDSIQKPEKEDEKSDNLKVVEEYTGIKLKPKKKQHEQVQEDEEDED